MRTYFVLVAALAGCAEKAIELRFEVSEGAQALDVSCVDTVHVTIHDGTFNFEELPSACIPVSGATSMADIQAQIRNKLDMDLPDRIIAVEVRGLAYSDPQFCGSGTNIFYAGAGYVDGQASVDLRAEGTLSCAATQTQNELKLHAIDFLALVDTPAGMPPVCQTPSGMVDLALGTIRPTNIDLPAFPTSIVDCGTGAAIGPSGTVTLPAYGDAEPTSCVAGASFDLSSASCIYPSATSLCGTGEVMVPIISGPASWESIDDTIYNDYPVIVIGQVWDTVTRTPIEGATVTFSDPARGEIVYADRGSNSSFVPSSGATATTAKGLFLAYMREPSVVTIQQGTTKKVMRLGGVSDWGSAVIVPLR
jgi:hypothetical protein